jgi:hypothetical protein
MTARASLVSLLGVCLLAGPVWADDASAIRLTTSEAVHYSWDRGLVAARKLTRIRVALGADGAGRLVREVHFRDEHDDAVLERSLPLTPAAVATLRERLESAQLGDLDGQHLGRLSQTHPRFELVTESSQGLTRVQGTGFGEHEDTVGALVRGLLALAPEGTTQSPDEVPAGELRLTLTRQSLGTKRGEGLPAYQLTKRTHLAQRGSRLLVVSRFEDSDGDAAATRRELTLSPAERAEVAERLSKARLPALHGVETSNVLAPDTPVYELALSLPEADPVVVRGEGYGRLEARLQPLVDLLSYLSRRGADLPSPDPAANRGATDRVDRLGD